MKDLQTETMLAHVAVWPLYEELQVPVKCSYASNKSEYDNLHNGCILTETFPDVVNPLCHCYNLDEGHDA